MSADDSRGPAACDEWRGQPLARFRRLLGRPADLLRFPTMGLHGCICGVRDFGGDRLHPGAPAMAPLSRGRFGKRRIAEKFERLRVSSALNTVIAFNIVAREVGSVRLLKEERHLPLEMGEREQDIEREPTHRGGGVELLGDREERKSALGRVSGLEKPNDFGKFLSHLRHKGQIALAKLYIDILRLAGVLSKSA